jgi:hypothetical protein
VSAAGVKETARILGPETRQGTGFTGTKVLAYWYNSTKVQILTQLRARLLTAIVMPVATLGLEAPVASKVSLLAKVTTERQSRCD